MDTRIEKLADTITRETTEAQQRYQARYYPDSPYDGTVNYTAHIIPGKKYIKMDVGGSGKYMIDGDKIFGIKAYGVIHRGHQYGTLDTIDEWYWGEYTATPRGTVSRVMLTKKAAE